MTDKEFLKHLEEIGGNKFDDDQIKAILYDCTNKNLRILAGAGSGKTAVICAKVAYLITVKHIDSNKICMMTFTKKAAAEMQERVDAYIKSNEYTNNVTIGTFHSVFNRLQKNFLNDYQEARSFAIYGSYSNNGEISNEIDRLTREYDLIALGQEGRSLQEKMSCWINANYSEEQIIENVKCQEEIKYKENLQADETISISGRLRLFFRDLHNFKDNRGIISFDDMLTNLRDMAENMEIIRDKLKAMFDYLIIDEFQDINALQMELIKYICPENGATKLIVVGDDDQSIYMFRGSIPSFIKNIDKTYNIETLSLMTNYRSNYHLPVALANCLIKKNKNDRVEKPEMKWSEKASARVKDSINHIHLEACDNVAKESERVLSDILKSSTGQFYEGIHTEDDNTIKEIKISDNIPIYLGNTILYRSKNQIQSIIYRLNNENILFIWECDPDDCATRFAITK